MSGMRSSGRKFFSWDVETANRFVSNACPDYPNALMRISIRLRVTLCGRNRDLPWASFFAARSCSSTFAQLFLSKASLS